MKRSSPALLAVFVGLVFFAPSAVCQTRTAEEVIRSSHIFGSTEYTSAEATMVVQGSRGEQTRKLEIYIHQQSSGGSKILAQIVWPAFLSNMKFLMHSDAQGSQERWMTTSRGVRRLSGSNFQDNVFNSDFTVEDFSYPSADDYRFSFGTPVRGLEVVEATVRDGRGDLSAKIYRIDAEAGLVREIDYVDDAGRVVRRFRTLETETTAGVEYPKRVEMADLQEGTRTVIEIDSVDIESSIPSRTFNRAAL